MTEYERMRRANAERLERAEEIESEILCCVGISVFFIVLGIMMFF